MYFWFRFHFCTVILRSLPKRAWRWTRSGAEQEDLTGNRWHSLVQVWLGLLTLNGGVQAVDIFFGMKPLSVLNGIVSLQMDKKGEFTTKPRTRPRQRGSGAAHLVCCAHSQASDKTYTYSHE